MLRLSVDHMNAEALFKRRSERIKAGLRLRRERLAKAAELSKGVRTPEEPQ